MAIRLMGPLPARVVQVLKDYLFTETTLIDAEEADGIVTPQIQPANFFDFDRKLVATYPACTVAALSSTPVAVQPSTTGQRIDARHRLEVKFHGTPKIATDGRTLEKIMQRYVNGAVRVLTVLRDGLETVLDPVRFGSPSALTVVEWRDAATYGPESDQGDGSIVRTATLPIDVRRTEPH